MLFNFNFTIEFQNRISFTFSYNRLRFFHSSNLVYRIERIVCLFAHIYNQLVIGVYYFFGSPFSPFRLIKLLFEIIYYLFNIFFFFLPFFNFFFIHFNQPSNNPIITYLPSSIGLIEFELLQLNTSTR